MINPKSIKQPFWSMSIEDTLSVFEVGVEGLSSEEANSRLKVFQPNEIKDGKTFSKLRLFLDQFRSSLILILIFAGIMTAFLGDLVDTVVIFSAVLLNVSLGFYQENKAENILELLKSYIKTRSRVHRSGREEIMDSSRLVPGDIMRITQGDKIPADARIIFANNFEVDESVLTGESIPVEKKAEAVETSLSLGDRASMVFGSTLAVRGFADVVVTSTGAHTEFGKIASLLSKENKTKTPLQVVISKFSFLASIILLVMTVILFSLGIYLHYDILDMFLIAVAVAVSAVPEGLPIALTIIMAVGVEQLAKRKAVVRKLLAAETLGSTSLILTDKTGTLTQAKMELTAVIPYNGSTNEDIYALLHKSLLTIDVLIENPEESYDKWRTFGNYMEIALANGAAKHGVKLTEILNSAQAIDRLPFNSEKKFSGAVYKENSEMHLILLGAPDILIKYTNLSEDEKKEVIEEINERALAGERVLGVVSDGVNENYKDLKNYDFKNLNFDGLISFRDPLRPGVFDAIRRIGQAGVRTIIVTGDHRGTAEAVARELGLIDQEGGLILTGDDIKNLSKEELYSTADRVKVYARVTPEQKVMIARMYKEKGEIVAMTGDGVNDAPVIEVADIGVALGSGTDVTKSAADLVILDDNYETIVIAIEQGRRILDNIRKVIVYLLSNSADEMFLIGGSIVAGLAMPLTALQILFVNFFSDSLPAIAFAFDKGVDEPGRYPRRLPKNLFDGQMKFLLFAIGVPTSALLFLIYYVLLKSGLSLDLVRTFIFASFASYTLLVSFSLRSLSKSILRYNPFGNIYLVIGVLVGLGFIGLAVYNPYAQRILGTESLPAVWLEAVIGIGIMNMFFIEFGKWIYGKLNIGK